MKVSILRQRNPGYNGPRVAAHRALYQGGTLADAKKREWFPKAGEEPVGRYERRMAQVTYTNDVSAIVDDVAGQTVSTPPALKVAGDPWWSAWSANVDRLGTDLAEFAAARLADVLVSGRTWVWINLPARLEGEVVANRAQEEALGLLEPYLVALDDDMVLDWGEDDLGRLTWLVFESVIDGREGIAVERRKTWRWTYIDPYVVRRWEWYPPEAGAEPDEESDAVELPEVIHRIGRLPALRWAVPPGLCLMERLHDPALRLHRKRNDQDWALHVSAHPLLVINTKNDVKPTLGEGYYLRLGAEDKATFVEPGGNSYSARGESIADSRDDLYRVVRQMAASVSADSSRIRQSGESKAQDNKAAEHLLEEYARRVRDWLRELAILVAAARGEALKPEAVSVTGLDGFVGKDVLGWLTSAALATEARGLSPTTKREIAKREVAMVLPDLAEDVRDQIHKEIDEAPIAETELYQPGEVTRGQQEDPSAPGAAGGRPGAPQGP